VNHPDVGQNSVTKLSFGIMPLSLFALLAACGDGQTNKATSERLAELRANGPDAERLAIAEERLATALGRDNATGALADTFDGDVAADGPTPKLNDLLALAIERHPDIGKAAQALNRADVERMNAIYGYLPQVSASASFSQITQEVVQTDNQVFELGEAEYPVTNLQLELSQPIFNLSRIFNIRIQRTAQTVAEVEYLATVQRVSFETFDAYVSAAQSKAKIRSLQQRMSLLGRQIANEDSLSDIGLSTEALSNSYASERANLASDEAVESARLAAALADLAYLSGSSVPDVEAIRVPASVLRSERNTILAAGIAAAEESNPALLASAISVVEAELVRKQAIASDFAPVLDAFARYEDETREGSRFGGGSQTRDTTYGVRLTIPIFNASGQGLQTTLRSVDLRTAALDYYATRRQLRAQVMASFERMTELSAAIGQSSTAVARAADNVALEQGRLASGESVDIAVVGRQLAESSSRETLEFQQLEYLRAWGRYQYLTGASLSVPGL
jgi:outer membrane protein TolC